MKTPSTPADDLDFSIEELENRFEMATTLLFDPVATSLSDQDSCAPPNPPDSDCSGTGLSSLTTP